MNEERSQSLRSAVSSIHYEPPFGLGVAAGCGAIVEREMTKAVAATEAKRSKLEATVAATPISFVEALEQPVGLLAAHGAVGDGLLDGIPGGGLTCRGDGILHVLQIHTGLLGQTGQCSAAPELCGEFIGRHAQFSGSRLQPCLTAKAAPAMRQRGGVTRSLSRLDENQRTEAQHRSRGGQRHQTYDLSEL